MIFVLEFELRNGVTELLKDFVVSGHVCGQDAPNDAFPGAFVLLQSQVPAGQTDSMYSLRPPLFRLFRRPTRIRIENLLKLRGKTETLEEFYALRSVKTGFVVWRRLATPKLASI